jgi:hypothetical protein
MGPVNLASLLCACYTLHTPTSALSLGGRIFVSISDANDRIRSDTSCYPDDRSAAIACRV